MPRFYGNKMPDSRPGAWGTTTIARVLIALTGLTLTFDSRVCGRPAGEERPKPRDRIPLVVPVNRVVRSRGFGPLSLTEQGMGKRDLRAFDIGNLRLRRGAHGGLCFGELA